MSKKQKSNKWHEFWAYCLVELGLPEERIYTLTFAEEKALRQAWMRKLEREDSLTSKICATMVNVVGAAFGSKRTMTPKDFMYIRNPNEANKQQLSEQATLALFLRAFAPRITKK